MKIYPILFCVLLFFLQCSEEQTQITQIDTPSQLVNTFIGTGGHGHTYPGASAPFGMVQLSPDTRTLGWDACSGYYDSDSSIIGFSHTHLSGTGAIDYGDILLMPYLGNITNQSGTAEDPDSGYRSRFSHKTETGTAGYYSVLLEDDSIQVELTTSKRVGHHRYTFLKEGNSTNIILDLLHGLGDSVLESEVEQTSENEIVGKRISRGWAQEQHVYFVAQFTEPIQEMVLFKDNEELEGNRAEGQNLQAVLQFNIGKDRSIGVKVALSAVSIEGARLNLEKEAIYPNFKEAQLAVEKQWDMELKKIAVDMPNKEDAIIYYTALYHSFLNPNLFNDVDGKYRGMDKKIHQSDHDVYTVYSLWDTFRATHPLFTVAQPKRATDIINTLLLKYNEHGLLPVWELAGNETGTMIGYHSIPVLADAIVKDIEGIDLTTALKAMKTSAMEDHLGLKPFKEQGYIPAELEHESVSKIMEYSYDDWCIAQIAKMENDQEGYRLFMNRAQYYKNAYDTTSGFMRPKRNGNWDSPFDPYEVTGNYTEANAWQYTWFAPHDIAGLTEVMKNKANFISRLDELFTTSTEITGRKQPDISGMIGQYAHGNEPSHHLSYLYSYLGKPSKTQNLTRKICKDFYLNQPDGLIGNEDCGQMSSWYNFTALGFYPVVPGSDQYIFTSPVVNNATINLDNGNQFHVHAVNNSDENIYIQSISLNGKKLDRHYITHKEITQGGRLTFEMGNSPNDSWLTTDPVKENKEAGVKSIARIPVVESEGMTFLDSTKIAFSEQEGSKIHFTIDGSTPSNTSQEYSAPFYLKNSASVRAIAIKEGLNPSTVVNAKFIKIPFGRKIELKHQYNHVYTGNSPMALIDFIEGTESFRNGWQGFYGDDLEAIIDLNKTETVQGVSCNFYHETYNWIFSPEYFEVYTSMDGINFTKVGKMDRPHDIKKEGTHIVPFSVSFSTKECKYIKIIAKNIGLCPEWHKGHGGKAWIFADEIKIETL